MAVALIVAAGRGERLGSTRPKALVPLRARPMVEWSVLALQAVPQVERIVVALPGDSLDDVPVGAVAVAGGKVRSQSVRNALDASAEGDPVIVHDAARPLATPELFVEALEQLERSGVDAVVAGTRVADTIKELETDGRTVRRTLDRSRLWAVQTPQVFRRRVLERVLGQAPDELLRSATDDAWLVEQAGGTIGVVDGGPQNIKVTTETDLRLAELLLAARKVDRIGSSAVAESLTGIGYDRHRFAEGRRLVLGGVEIEHSRGLQGHSDADVLTHAIIDALLGAAALEDIGRHFPDTDERYRDADSLELLRSTVSLLAQEGLSVVNVDATVLLERPSLAPHREAIRATLADALGIPLERVSVKATRGEGIGFEGREEGAAALAVATVRP